MSLGGIEKNLFPDLLHKETKALLLSFKMSIYPNNRAGGSYVMKSDKNGYLVQTYDCILYPDPEDDPIGLDMRLGQLSDISDYVNEDIHMIGTALVYPDTSISHIYVFYDAIVEYRDYAGTESMHEKYGKRFSSVYLGTWACIGIPIPRMHWLLQQLKPLVRVSDERIVEKDGYSWILAKMASSVTMRLWDEDNQHVCQFGSVLDVMTKVKKSMYVLLQTAIRLRSTRKGVFELSFLLKDMFIKNYAEESSPFKDITLI
ncbi:hypothetical protein BDB01DRAFT_467305 [Pilobolus umbonatus]|nr:hypothetical protein BDB01DRAFT_467305 [Pilobolus umbonatus]